MARRRKFRGPVGAPSRNWIRAGDTVQVMSGDEAGTRDHPRRARVLHVHLEQARVLVEGINKVFRHVRKSQEHPRGGRVEKEAPIALARVRLVCPSCGRPSRRKVGRRTDGSRTRLCSACGQEIPLPKG
ncbi:MAG: 50S ribosomal protein L24 [Planctomycetes bacterium]|nr:50S ribosomal protein L24 [Planctomycetota bacterium]